jgi:hypothetical protein
VTGGCRKLNNAKVHNLYSSQSIIRIINSRRIRKWAGVYGEKRKAYRFLVRKSEGKRLLRRPRRRWIDNINIDLV